MNSYLRSESRQDFRPTTLNSETLGEFRYW